MPSNILVEKRQLFTWNSVIPSVIVQVKLHEGTHFDSQPPSQGDESMLTYSPKNYYEAFSVTPKECCVSRQLEANPPSGGEIGTCCPSFDIEAFSVPQHADFK